jgi:peptidoglycan/xylan/chitin deacetylase (PgdA/CDA1 family)
VLLFCAAVAVGAVGGRALSHGHGAGELRIRVRGHAVTVAAGTTLGHAVSMFDLRPRAGDLLDVEGRVLRRAAFAGAVVLNGHGARAATVLHAGDRVSVAGARDRREPVRRQIVPLPDGAVPNPQFFLLRTPGRELVLRGAISHKLVSARFVADGRPVRVEPAVALTFDDGPSPEYTPRILAMLRRLRVHATFFVIGYLADRYPQLVREELRAGMSVGNHSYNHPEVPPFDRLPRPLIADEITLGAHSLQRIGADPRLFRPPGGSFSAQVVQAAQRLRQRVVLWSVDPGDWQPGATAARIARAVLSAARPGSIVILHDGGGDRAATVRALPAIVRGIRRRHLRLVAIPAS